MKEELLKGLTKEQIARVKACKNSEEILALAKEEGFELTDEQLEAVSGGCGTIPESACPDCGSKNVDYRMDQHAGPQFRCLDCGRRWRG